MRKAIENYLPRALDWSPNKGFPRYWTNLIMLPDTYTRGLLDVYDVICEIRLTKEETLWRSIWAEMLRYGTLSNLSCGVKASLSGMLSYRSNTGVHYVV